MRGERAGQLAAQLESADLGRRLTLEVRAGSTWSDGRPVSAVDVARALVGFAEPRSPRYLGRWADLLDRVEAIDSTHVEFRLTRPLLKLESWLVTPVGPAHTGANVQREWGVRSADRHQWRLPDSCPRRPDA